ncbi:MAG: GGDEF domain-containing protein [Rhodanobacteraceae bacterium]|nr:GGDEF domain-containing protein [Rhodanobacteraceae bacterium]
MTGLSRRRVFEQSLEQEIARSTRRNREFVLAIVDVDELSKINREWGKVAGDDVLKQVARALKAGLREEDLLCRFGGEEFAAMLPETGIDEAEKLLNSVRSAIANVEFFIQGQSRSASVSIGAVLWNPSYKTGAALIDRTEEKLKAAKDGGRNRIAW